MWLALQHKFDVAANPSNAVDPAERNELGDGHQKDEERHTEEVDQRHHILASLKRTH